ncbi:aspartate carbamoyltransferase catalytic subunit [Oenococcus oeni]|uniref:Aspartate carbamoyltransferase n=1 Tax=Oenococcus oeni TaxID=1247 RepID=A0AAJ2UB90_OENOE|nr:aspartate carbamoyltransferase catalytic subunit [Oenococcus oeni]EJO02323.1 aspartate carbamoyltransferase catalytic subunit [Oenococcus oeni AWRIB418]MDV7715081.1 aspartate carbamoyltransferase catalytic subunit [Oenococcus oeni]OIK57766.1 aspartate carbamoyltransferase [Oenococcus oeni]OIK88418.1 aspartate carbamoyltransferase [Oenococcus oeni]OIL16005.1 aspartate carbamoyltransferase [Oenococcus oeni]
MANVFVNINDLSDQELLSMIHQALLFKSGQFIPVINRQVVANLFFENSTRTATSFQMAEMKLGYQRIVIDPNKSSATKGESLEDTLKTLKAIGIDTVVIRHSLRDWYQPFYEMAGKEVPKLVNAGDGNGQHPSQSLLDLMTIVEHFENFAGLRVRIIGDIYHSRVARSNAEILNRLGVEVTFSGPKEWQDQSLEQFGSFVDIDEDLGKQDVIMLLRVQHERLTDEENQDFTIDKYHEDYGLTKDRYRKLKSNAIIMHPAPVNRGVEIDSDLVEADKSRIFQQMKNGVYARMAILNSLTIPSLMSGVRK